MHQFNTQTRAWIVGCNHGLHCHVPKAIRCQCSATRVLPVFCTGIPILHSAPHGVTSCILHLMASHSYLVNVPSLFEQRWRLDLSWVPADGPLSNALLLARRCNNFWDLHNLQSQCDSVWLNELFLCPFSGKPLSVYGKTVLNWYNNLKDKINKYNSYNMQNIYTQHNTCNVHNSTIPEG